MAQNRSQQPQTPGPGTPAGQPAVALRFGRAAREAIGRPANDNRASPGRRLAVALVRAGLIGVAAYAIWRWIG
ncbi:MAG: hypothetical protein JNM30_06955 [Rhodospirillales bacterium]|nr:hypothetical protein [Rhodospirillales bacterium]